MSIVDNKKAFFDYFVEERFEAGLVLEGWEVKAIRAGRVHVKEAYVVIRQAELFLIGCHITPYSRLQAILFRTALVLANSCSMPLKLRSSLAK